MLGQGLGMMQGQGATLGNPQAVEQDAASKLTQMLEAYRANMSQMPQSDYAEGSGGLGALGMIAEAAAQKYGSTKEGKGMFGGKK
jgi:hypothetical protein